MTRSKRLLPATVATVVTALTLAACGSDPSTSSEARQEAPNPEASSSPGEMQIGSEDGGMQMMMQPLDKIVHEEMRIELASAEPATFTIFQGDQTREVTPGPDDSMHLMAVLADDETGERIPYSTVWATITDASGDVVFDERLWPMISRAMGTHYGINVALPGPGSYDVSVQVGPPQAARHPEYADRWQQPYTFETTIDWEG